MTQRRKFWLLTERLFPATVRQRVAAGEYALIVLNDDDFLPWVRSPRFGAGRDAHVHLDLHEYFIPTLTRNTLWKIATAGYYAWCRGAIADPTYTTRSTVASGIARLYEREYDLPEFAIIRNSPDFVDQRPTATDGARIRLIHHGVAQWVRGLRTMVEAIRLLDSRFSLTLMLAGDPAVIRTLEEETADLGDRVRIVPPVPMAKIAHEVNQYDLEVMFYRPTTRNLEYALPNKFFEAVQGRLGLVVGESPMMAELVTTHGLGVVVAGWEAADLAAALHELGSDDVTAFKAASDRVARSLSAEAERDVFLATIGEAS
jgi:glycosyltransferase involved in cell wall biosynthesis